MKIENIDDIISHALAFINDDYTELWLIFAKIQEENEGLNFNELIEATKFVISELVDNHKIFLLDEKTQMPLSIEKGEMLDIIEKRLLELNRAPNIGDGIWFTR